MMKKTILACVFLQLVLGTVFAQTVDSTHIKNMHAYYKKHFSDPTDPIVLTASDTLLDMAIRCNDTVMSKIALGAKLDYYYYGQGENRTDSWSQSFKEICPECWERWTLLLGMGCQTG